jgi:hypothetical protein
MSLNTRDPDDFEASMMSFNRKHIVGGATPERMSVKHVVAI